MATPRSPYANPYWQMTRDSIRSQQQPSPTPEPSPTPTPRPYGGMNVVQEGYDALAKKEKEIKEAAIIEGMSIGMNREQAIDYGNKSFDLFKNKQMLEVQKKFVDLEAQRQNLETEKKKSTQQNDLMKFINGIPRDTQNLRDFPNKSIEYAAANHAILYHPVEEIRTIAQNEIKKVNDEYDRFHGGALKEASKYDLSFIPAEALGENGHLDDERLYKLGMPHYKEKEQREKQEKLEELRKQEQMKSDIEKKRQIELATHRSNLAKANFLTAKPGDKTPTADEGSSTSQDVTPSAAPDAEPIVRPKGGGRKATQEDAMWYKTNFPNATKQEVMDMAKEDGYVF
jgi:hypothetical protein